MHKLNSVDKSEHVAREALNRHNQYYNSKQNFYQHRNQTLHTAFFWYQDSSCARPTAVRKSPFGCVPPFSFAHHARDGVDARGPRLQ